EQPGSFHLFMRDGDRRPFSLLPANRHIDAGQVRFASRCEHQLERERRILGPSLFHPDTGTKVTDYPGSVDSEVVFDNLPGMLVFHFKEFAGCSDASDEAILCVDQRMTSAKPQRQSQYEMLVHGMDLLQHRLRFRKRAGKSHPLLTRRGVSDTSNSTVAISLDTFYDTKSDCKHRARLRLPGGKTRRN